MNFKKSSFIAAAGIAAMLAGCTSSDDPSGPSGSKTEDDRPSFEVAACEEITDEDVRKEMDEAQETFFEFIDAFGVSDFERAGEAAGTIKSVYGKALKANPGNCEAQLGYALATITDLLNNKTLTDVIDTINSIVNGPESDEEFELPEVVALHKLGANEASKLIVKAGTVAKKTDQKVITDRLQDAIADELLPAVDTAIIYLSSIGMNSDFEMSVKFEDNTLNIDQSVTAPALGSVYVLRAVLTALASFNIDFSKDGKYDWIDSLLNLNETNYKDNVGAQYAVELLSYDNPFGTVKDEWKDRYLKIPEDLRKAITSINCGFMYKLEKIETGKSQENDLYIVGDDEDADLSVKDMQSVMDTLEAFKNALEYGTIKVELDDKKTLDINLKSFFKLTSDVKAYAPYYEMVHPQDWFKSEYITWGDEFEGSGAEYYVTTEIQNTLTNSDNVLYNSVYFEDDGDGLILSVAAEYDEGRAEATYSVTIDGCEVKFIDNEDYEYISYDEDSDFVPAKYDFGEVIVLPEEKCRIDDGEVRYADDSGAPNIFNLTDSKGKVTISFTELINGTYDPEELKHLIVFPDYTFAGVFPKMTKDEFWSIMDEYVLGLED